MHKNVWADRFHIDASFNHEIILCMPNYANAFHEECVNRVHGFACNHRGAKGVRNDAPIASSHGVLKLSFQKIKYPLPIHNCFAPDHSRDIPQLLCSATSSSKFINWHAAKLSLYSLHGFILSHSGELHTSSRCVQQWIL